MKRLIYERNVQADDERVGLRLYQAAKGFLLERYLIQSDLLTLVQMLSVASQNHLDRFESADPHRLKMEQLYREVRNIVVFEMNKEIGL